MEIDKKAQAAIEMIQIQLKELIDIVSHAREDNDSTIERLRRWKSRTVKLLSDRINPEEGLKLQEITRNFTSWDPVDDILYDSKQYRAFLSSLKEELEKHPEEVLSVPVAKSEGTVIKVKTATTPSIASHKKVFVIHGRNEKLRVSIFRLLRALGLDPIEWTQAIALTRKSSPYISEIIDAGLTDAQAALVLLSGDDEAKLREQYLRQNDPEYEKQLMPQARPNVLFEAGMAMGKYQERTILVQVGNLRKWTDVEGRHVTYLNNSYDKRHELAIKLQTAGCLVDLSGADWTKEGDFGDEADVPVESNRTSVASVSQVRGKAQSLIIKQANELHSKVSIALQNRDPILEREYRIEYVKLLGSAFSEWLEDDTIRHQLLLLNAEAGSFDIHMIKSDKLATIKWVLNSVEKMLTILQT